MRDAKAVSELRPVQVLVVELTDRLPASVGAAAVLVRLHGVPLGVAHLPGGGHAVPAEQLATLLTEQVLEAVNSHLRADGHDPVTQVPATGIGLPPTPCAALDQATEVTSVSVVVPTLGRDRLRQCLAALADQQDVAGLLEGGTFEVVVVDNAPAQPTTRLLLEEFPDVRYVQEPRPGVSYARNRGLVECTGDVVAFVDDDTVVDPGWLRAVLLAFAGEPGAACVTGLVLSSEFETEAQRWFEQYGGFAKGFDRVVHHRTAERGLLYPYLPGSFGTGANAAFRTEWLRASGGFDPALGGGNPPVGGEDIDVLMRVVLAGERLVYEPRAVAWHPPHREMEALRQQMYVYGRGLSAVLTKAALSDPKVAWDILCRIPPGLRFLLDSKSPKNAHKAPTYPRELSHREWLGFLSGPGSYLLARRRVRSAARSGAR